MTVSRLAWICLAVLITSSADCPARCDEIPAAPKWRKHAINDRSPFEAAGVADFDGDGHLDVFSGDSWYAGPSWTRHKVRDVPSGTNPHYREDFADQPLDVNGDGKPDIVTCAYFSRKVAWLENPGQASKPWTEHLIDRPGSMETGYLVNLGPTRNHTFLPNVGGRMMLYELTAALPKPRWTIRQLSPEGAGHGLGHGDVNQDGRIDIITPKGWYEQPADPDGRWPFHAEFSLGNASIEILCHDFDGDGLGDIAWGMGHGFGLHWLRQSKDAAGKRVWTRGDIDDSFSQAHTLHLGDFDGDGELEFVTGKRVYAHASEPGATEKPCLYRYRFDRKSAKWEKTIIDEGEPATEAPLDPEKRDALVDFKRGSAGTGLLLAVHDVDRDGDLDIVAPGKSGLYWFENLRITKVPASR